MEQTINLPNSSKTTDLDPELKKFIRDNFLKFLKIAHKKKVWPEEQIKDALHQYILKNFKVNIPRKKVCPNHDAPFDFVYAAFMAQYKRILAMANRSGGKTLDMAIIGLLDVIGNDNCESSNLGAIQVQARRCAKYMQDFINANPDFQARLASAPTTEKIKWHNASVNEILVASLSGVNGPHPQRLKMDEVELIPWPIIQEAFSTVQSKNGVDSCMVLGSTRKFAAGPMQRFMDEHVPKGNIKLFQWCIWEVVEKLPDDPAEVERIKQVFGEYLPADVEACSGYYAWSDLIETFRTLDRNVWETQWECKRADTQGLVYGRFDDVLNIAKDFQVNREMLNNGWAKVYIFEDFGSTKDHPNVILYAWVDLLKSEVIVFDELYLIDKGTQQIIDEAMAKLSEHGLTRADISGWIGDPHAAGEQLDRYNMGLPMLGNRFVSEDQQIPGELLLVKNGIPHMRKFIDDRRLKLTENCREFRGELMSYAYAKRMDGTFKDEPEKRFDHGCDCCRQGLIWLFPMEAAGSFGSDAYAKDDSLDDSTFTRGLWEKKF
jgi:hypothetical protein